MKKNEIDKITSGIREVLLNLKSDDIDDIISEITELLLKKNADYGGASFDNDELWARIGNEVHLHDKVMRYRSLIDREIREGLPPNCESIEDTVKDILGYAIIGLLILKKCE